MCLEQPIHADFVSISLFVGCECQNQIAAGHPTLPLPANEIRGQYGYTILHILRAAPIEIAVTFGELERIEIRRPVIAACFDHIEMADQQNRFIAPLTV